MVKNDENNITKTIKSVQNQSFKNFEHIIIDGKSTDKTLKILEGQFKERKMILLPRSKGNRNIILIQPKNFCPEIYPRKAGKPEKYPL